jgi:chromosomal replication initiation ATPase DnaA
LVRRLRNDTLNQVGDEFGITKYSTVSSIVEKVKKDMSLDKKFKNRIMLLIEKITKGQ